MPCVCVHISLRCMPRGKFLNTKWHKVVERGKGETTEEEKDRGKRKMGTGDGKMPWHVIGMLWGMPRQ